MSNKMNIRRHWGSHLPVLIKLMGMTDGPVLEMGMGLYSTPFMHWACFSQKRKIVSYDSDEKYFEMNKDYTDPEFHDVHFVTDWSLTDIERSWDVVLIDHTVERRSVDTMRLANHAKYIILHDTNWQQNKHYHYKEQVFPNFKYRFDYTATKPFTSVVSNLIDVTKLVI